MCDDDGGGSTNEGSTRPSTSNSGGAAELSPPVPNVPLVTQVNREDDRAKAKLEAGGRTGNTEVPPGSTFEDRLAMKAAAGMKKETGKEKKAEIGAKEEEKAQRRFADRLALKKMDGENSRTSYDRVQDVPEIDHVQAEERQGEQTAPGARVPSSLGEDSSTTADAAITADAEGPRSTRLADDCDDLEMAESTESFEDRAGTIRNIDDAAEMVADSQQTVTSNNANTQGAGGPRVAGRRQRSTILQLFRSNTQRHSGSPPDNTNSTRRANVVYDSTNPVEAMLVLEASVSPAEPVEVYEAEEVSFFERRASVIFGMLCIVLVTVALAVLLTMRSNETTTLEPTLQPTLSPTFDPRPALEVIQTRPTSSRKLRCGFHVSDLGKFRIELCRAIAAVVLGDPSAYEILHPTSETRWAELDSRRVDLLLYSSHTIERETREVCTVSESNCLFELERVKSHSAFFVSNLPRRVSPFRNHTTTQVRGKSAIAAQITRH